MVSNLFLFSSSPFPPLFHLYVRRGVIFRNSKILVVGWLGKIYVDLLRKKREYNGKGVEKREIFTVLGVRKKIMDKRA